MQSHGNRAFKGGFRPFHEHIFIVDEKDAFGACGECEGSASDLLSLLFLPLGENSEDGADSGLTLNGDRSLEISYYPIDDGKAHACSLHPVPAW